ncbi:MAG: hypothetical protein M3O30_18835 [Planctomycetota bacterium]|nr:hypothetical protein [Planctomycetota bacterium]
MTLSICAVAWIWDTQVIGNSKMDFYGRVVDPNNQGIPNALVDAEITTNDFFTVVYLWHGPSNETYKVSVNTDKNGDFELHCRGTDINIIDFHSPGYHFDWSVPVSGTNLPEGYFVASDKRPGKAFPSDPAHRMTYALQKVSPG